MNLFLVFITGLTVGGLTCLAVQGGLLAAVIAAGEDEEIKSGVKKRNTLMPTIAFLIAKLIAYVGLGFVLGAFGGVIGINQTGQIIMQFLAGVYMVAIALNLLEVHPIFRYAVIGAPKFLTRRIRNQSKSRALFAPALLGAMTIFIPCGTTLAIEALAISQANPIKGAAILGVFVLGSSPLFLGVGWLTSVLGENYRTKFLKVAAVVVIYLGIMSMNGALVAIGSPVSLQTVADGFINVFRIQSTDSSASSLSTAQSIEISVEGNGYFPNYFRVRKGETVNVTLNAKNTYSCATAFRIPSLNISRNLQAGETYTFSFRPEKNGKIPFSCSMGMYRGVIEVI